MGLDCIVDGAAGDALAQFTKLLAPGGRIVSYGVTAGPPGKSFGAHLPVLFLNNAELRGTAMCSPAEFDSMLMLVKRANIVPVVDSVWPMGKLPEALGKMRDGKQLGKIVLVNEWSGPGRAKL